MASEPTDDPQRLESLYWKCSALDSASEREALLDKLCPDEPELREKVLRMIAAENDAECFADNLFPYVDWKDHQTPMGAIIGPYKLREKIGEGGFGVVYVAEQEKPIRRKVALKLIKPGMDSKQVLARFEAERQALGLMNHPNVASVIDAGTTESGRPYFAMELVFGKSITKFCDENRLSIGERLELFLDVCRGVHHAHQKGIIHRDLKPSNVLVTMNDDKPLVKVIDFGVAKALSQPLTEHSIYTGYGQVLGTPMYMSPEQAQFNAQDVDIRSDVYSLGVCLYELLSGDSPFDRERFRESNPDDLFRMIREDDPPRPSARASTLGAKSLSTVSFGRRIDDRKLIQALKGELDWIVMKALEKNRERRYESALAFAQDVQRVLDDEVVEARPPSISYRFQKSIRRYRLTYAFAAALLVGLTSLIAAALVHARNLETLADDRAELLTLEEQQRKQAERQTREANARLAQALLEQARIERTTAKLGYRESVDRLLKEVQRLDTTGQYRQQIRDEVLQYIGDPISIPPKTREIPGKSPTPISDAIRPLLHPQHREEKWLPRYYQVSEDERYFASCIDPDETGNWKLLDVHLYENGKRLRSAPTRSGHLLRLRFSHDNQYLAAACSAGFVVWSIPDLTEQLRIGGDQYPDIAFHPYLPFVSTTVLGRGIELWSFGKNQKLASLPGARVSHSQFSDQGNELIRIDHPVPDANGKVDYKIRNGASWKFNSTPEKKLFLETPQGARHLAWSNDDQLLLSSASDDLLRYLDVAQGVSISSPKNVGHAEELVFNNRGSRYVTIGLGTANIFGSDHVRQAEFKVPYGSMAWAAQFTPNDEGLVVAGTKYGKRGVIHWWDVLEDKESLRLKLRQTVSGPARFGGMAMHPNGKEVALLCWDQTRPLASIYRWRLGDSAPTKIANSRYGLPRFRFVRGGRELIYLTSDGDLAAMDWPSGKRLRYAPLNDIPGRQSGYFFDGKVSVCESKMLAVVHTAIDQLSLIDLRSGKLKYTLPKESSEIWAAYFSNSGDQLAVSMSNGQVSVWNLPVIEQRLRAFGVWDVPQPGGWVEATLPSEE